jgi:Tol biopolymer transport system component/tRNA A-37 threonylcarbamoyl transferase component Bud32
MTLSAGTRLGPYEIVASIGAGAMGEVYKARDTRLNRDVAIKVLPPAFARDPDRLARFEREARAVAAINHPNILAVHDIGTADIAGVDAHPFRATYMITELLDGETLRAKLTQGPLPLRKSIDVAMQVARGLAAAHDRGIVHRDLKPDNIVLTRDGHVKILDFGLAKPSADDDQTMAGTEAGMVMGTVGYMAPEQVRSEPVDSRADLFALGAVLYELADGRRAFLRPTAAETMTAILHEDAPALRAGLSPRLDAIVRHALEKQPGDRFQSARDFAFGLQALNESLSAGAEEAILAAGMKTGRRSVRARELAAWTIAVLAASLAAVLFLSNRGASSESAAPVIFTASMPGTEGPLSSPSVSPDGKRIAFVVRATDGNSIWVRSLDAIQAKPLKGTANVRGGSVFWSPDGRSLGFFGGGKLKTIDLATERVEQLADAPAGYGGTWGPDGTILFSPDDLGPILRVSAKGGTAQAVTTLDATRQDQAHRWPQFLADGRHFVFMPWNSAISIRSIQLASLDGGASKTLFASQSAALVAGEYLIFVEDRPSRLMAQKLNPATFALDGPPVRIVTDDNVDLTWDSGYPRAAASAGTLIYSTGKFLPSQLTWFSRAGRPAGTVGGPATYYDPTLSLDGTALAVEQRDMNTGSTDLWTVDLARGAFSRLTTMPGFESVATWSPDGRRIAFASDDSPAPRMLIRNANGTGADEVVMEGRSYVTDWSRDGERLIYVTDGGATRFDVGTYDLTRRVAEPFLRSPFNELRARLSPDGKWMAYLSDESGPHQVYVRSFPDGATKIQISAAGGNQPEWRRDGKELFFLAPDSTLMAATVRMNGTQLVVDAPEPLFQTHVDQTQVIRSHYAASVDGQRFLVLAPVGDPKASPFIAVLNWQAGLR